MIRYVMRRVELEYRISLDRMKATNNVHITGT